MAIQEEYAEYRRKMHEALDEMIEDYGMDHHFHTVVAKSERVERVVRDQIEALLALENRAGIE